MHARNLLAAPVALCLLAALCPPARAGDNYQVDPVHSSVVFRVKHMGVGYSYGRFNDIGGTFAFDDKDPAATSFDIQLKADSVDTANAKRDTHLKSPDFLNAKEFPTITFKSKEVRPNKDGGYEVTGDLTLRGVTKTITVRMHHVGSGKDPFGGGTRTGFEGNFTVKRKDFGINFMPDALGDDIWILVGFEGVKK
jgi:polyisoprenoid-binding protein YceI